MAIPFIIPLLAAAKMGSNIYRQQKNQQFQDAQKGLLEAQLKSLKANEERQAAHDAFMASLPPDQRLIFGSKDPLETFAAQKLLFGAGSTSSPQAGSTGLLQAGSTSSPQAGSTAPPAGAAAASGSILGMSPQQVAEQVFRKKLGLGDEKKMERETTDPTGRRGRAIFNFGTMQFEPGTFIPEKQATERVEVTRNGKTYYQWVDPATQQPVGEPVEKEAAGDKPLGTTEANTIALTKSSLRDAQTALDALYSDGSPDAMRLLSAQVSAPGSKGREFSQAWDRAVKPLMVALTGTGMSEREAANIINMSKPQVGDGEQSIRNKAESLVNFMQERLKLMDPRGQYGVVNVVLPWQRKQAGSTGSPQAGGDLYQKYGITPGGK